MLAGKLGSRRLPLQQALVVLTFFLVFFLFFHEGVLRNESSGAALNITEVANKTSASALSREKWIEMAIETQIDGEFEDSAIKRLCGAAKWHRDRVIRCDIIRGGIGNVRNEVLQCARFAIEAGAAIVIPKIILRSQTDLLEIFNGEYIDFEYFFDKELFVQRLSTACPQLKIYEDMNDLGHPVKELPLVDPENFGGPLSHKKAMLYPDMWLPGFEEWFNSFGPTDGVLTVAPLTASLSYYPICRDGNRFSGSFGHMLEFRSDIRRLAASALYELSTRYSLNIDPAVGIEPGKYFGVHLRTADDATRLGWINYDTQKDRYLEQCTKSDLDTIYVASGNQPDIKRFASAAYPRNVVTKFDLLPDVDAAELGNMTWDQQALVDYEILLKSSMFAGMTDSSYSWNIATRRRVVSDTVLCSHWPTSLPPDTASKDNLSLLIGDREAHPEFSIGIWP